MELNIALSKLDRVTAWILWALFLIMSVSGYMLTKGFIDRYWGFLAHFDLAVPTMAVFTVHFAIRVRFILLKWRMREGLLVNLAPVLVGVALFLPVLYLNFFLRFS